MELIQAKEAMVIWKDDSKSKITNVLICHEDSQPKWADNSRGSSNSEWMVEGEWRGTPMGVFLEMVTTGFADENVKIEALKEFTKIEGQDWAYDLLQNLGVEMDRAEAA